MPRQPKFSLDRPPDRDRWKKALGDQVITSRAGMAKYSSLFGVPLSRVLLSGWLRKGHLRRAGGAIPGKPTILWEAELAYCAEVHAWRKAVGIPHNVPLLVAGGKPGVPTNKPVAIRVAEHRARVSKGIRLRPSSGTSHGSPAERPRGARKPPSRSKKP